MQRTVTVMTKFLKKCIIILLVLFSVVCRTALPAIPLFDEYGNLTDGSKEICNILGISDEVTDAETFSEYFRDNIYRSRPFVGARYSYCSYVSKLDEKKQASGNLAVNLQVKVNRKDNPTVPTVKDKDAYKEFKLFGK